MNLAASWIGPQSARILPEKGVLIGTGAGPGPCWGVTWFCAKSDFRGNSGRSVILNKNIIIGRVINVTGMIGVLAATVLFTFALVLILFRRGFGLYIPNSIHWFW